MAWSEPAVRIAGFDRASGSRIVTPVGDPARFGELVNRARFGRERVILTEHGKAVAAIISEEELAESQAAVAAADVAAATALKATGEVGIPHGQVMAAAT